MELPKSIWQNSPARDEEWDRLLEEMGIRPRRVAEIPVPPPLPAAWAEPEPVSAGQSPASTCSGETPEPVVNEVDEFASEIDRILKEIREYVQRLPSVDVNEPDMGWSNSIDDELLPLLPPRRPATPYKCVATATESDSSTSYETISEDSYEYEYEYEYETASESSASPPPPPLPPVLPDEMDTELITEADLAAVEEAIVAAEAEVAAVEAAACSAEDASSEYTYTYDYTYSDVSSSESSEVGRLSNNDDSSSSEIYDLVELISQAEENVQEASFVEEPESAANVVCCQRASPKETESSESASSSDTEEDWAAPRPLRKLLSFLDQLPRENEIATHRFVSILALYVNVVTLLPDEDYDEINWSHYFGDWERLMNPDIGFEPTFVLQSLVNGVDALVRDMIARHPEESKRPYFKMYLDNTLQHYQLLVGLIEERREE